MSILIDFGNTSERLKKFNNPRFAQRYQSSPTLRALTHTLIAMEWEGTPDILSDAFCPAENDLDTYQKTLERLGYQCTLTRTQLNHLDAKRTPAFIEFEKVSVVLLDIREGQAHLYDYKNDTLLTHALEKVDCTICEITEYSKIFREPPPESQDKTNWIKYTFYRYNGEIKSLIWLSLVINLLGAMQPFFIMGVYNFALTSGSQSTLFGLTLLAIFLALSEFGFKRLRMNILATSGQDLAVHISRNVVSKLLWLPYSMTSSAGVSSQIARLKDIDQFRRLVTAESTLSYFDMPFVIIFIVAITIMSGQAALTVIAGIILMLVFCVYARYVYTQATSKSSRANAMVSYQWNEVLRNIKSVQGLPLLNVFQTRFKAAHSQSLTDAENVAITNGRIQSLGQSLVQVIGTASIVTAVFGVMEGTTDAGAMLAIIILVWKALGPIMGIYNSISKFQSLKAAAGQINALMSLNDDKTLMEKSPPIDRFIGSFKVDGLTHRHQFMAQGLTNLGFKISRGEKISISGPSGSGKTTLLSLLAGLDERYQGSIFLDGHNIKQFNSFRYRKSVNYIPFDLHIFEGTLASNFVIHNGVMPREEMEDLIQLLEIVDWLPKGIDTYMSSDFLQSLPSGVLQSIRLALGLGQCQSNVLLIDEPFAGCEKEHVRHISKLFTGKLSDKTVIFSTNDTSLIAASNNCLLLEHDGGQKYFGFPDKVIQAFTT
ncbi:ATP-binding cassette domain-containing protein [Vibrio sp. SCSIO 43135]|uniref:ATP-binding cassette domain-containing protein n=1 Tax=Vibrio sp. SCSIO 43135 TaxID=2819096 RepID=UPI0020756B30|nr:ATP-binding cassette domain-containing protein [Vibrio sp. SCSIO 43135]USD40038.1 ATP-binding cassette domain-containing protein [Vibrio sp. SCSIO 43135]